MPCSQTVSRTPARTDAQHVTNTHCQQRLSRAMFSRSRSRCCCMPSRHARSPCSSFGHRALPGLLTGTGRLLPDLGGCGRRRQPIGPLHFDANERKFVAKVRNTTKLAPAPVPQTLALEAGAFGLHSFIPPHFLATARLSRHLRNRLLSLFRLSPVPPRTRTPRHSALLNATRSARLSASEAVALRRNFPSLHSSILIARASHQRRPLLFFFILLLTAFRGPDVVKKERRLGASNPESSL